MNGAKIMSIYVPGMGITFKDSLNYSPTDIPNFLKPSGSKSCEKDTFLISFTRKRTRSTREACRKRNGTTPTVDEDTINAISQKLMAELYRLTQYRKKQLGINYPGNETVEMWEYNWGRTWKELSDDVKERIDVTDRYEPLNPREALYGGRTEATKVYHKVDGNGEVICYLDFTSLYPYVNKYCEYVVGHPEIITDDFRNVSTYFG